MISQFIIDCLHKTPTAKKPLLKLVVIVTIHFDMVSSFYKCLSYFIVRTEYTKSESEHR